MQRLFDIAFSGLALLLLSPLFFILCLLLRFSGEGEIFFFQERLGLGGKTFRVFKFATMKKNSPNMDLGTVTVKDDPRILPVGKILRKTKINEIPQLINVLTGDMSLIGPRPLTSETFSAYPEDVQSAIRSVRPGLSGVGSIIFRGEEEILVGERGSIKFYREVVAPYKGALEQWFVRHSSLRTYFLAIGLTLWVVLFPDSGLAWKVFKDLPKPRGALARVLNFAPD